MQFALLYIHKVNSGTRGIVNIFDLEPDAMTAAADQALARPDFIYFVCPMQTQVSGSVQVATTVIAPTVIAPSAPAKPTVLAAPTVV